MEIFVNTETGEIAKFSNWDEIIKLGGLKRALGESYKSFYNLKAINSKSTFFYWPEMVLELEKKYGNLLFKR